MGLSSGITNNVVALAWWNSNLYAGGRFEAAGDMVVGNIAQWNGGSWQSLAGGCNSNVLTMAVWRGDLYVGGRFTMVGDVAVSRLARWDGNQWHNVGDGVDGSEEFPGPAVRALAASPEGLYVAGQFTTAGSVPATNIARWDGTNWHALKQGWSGTVNAIAARDGEVFVGGALTDPDGQSIDGVMRWDGTNWHSLGTGVDDRTGNARVFALLARQDDVFVGGRFTSAGGKPSANVARWVRHPRLRISKLNAGNQVSVRVTGEPGIHLHLETSTDLKHWNPFDWEDQEHSQRAWEQMDGATRFFRTRNP
jgi:hypothetical protein